MNKVTKKKLNSKASALQNLKASSHEQMKYLRNLKLEKEKLEERIAAVHHDCDMLKEILSCTSKDDIQDIIKEFLPQHHSLSAISSDDRNAFISNVSVHKFYTLQKHLGITVQRLNDVDTWLVEFVYPTNYQSLDLCLIKLKKEKQKRAFYKLDHYILPDVVPVEDLQKTFLDGTEAQNVPAFLNYIQQYLFCYWKRDTEVEKIKMMSALQNSLIYHNRSRTFISLTLDFMNEYTVEIGLRYELLSFVPYSVTYKNSSKKSMPVVLTKALEELERVLVIHKLSDILNINFGSDDSDGKAPSETASSDNSVIFELFK